MEIKNQWYILIGSVLTLLGVLHLAGQVFHFEAQALCLPIVLILLGAFLLFRPQLVGPGTAVELKLLGDVKRRAAWQAGNEEIWLGVGDVTLDFTGAEIPPGETTMRVFGMVNGVKVIVPPELGIKVSSMSFFSEARILGEKKEAFFTPTTTTSPNYDTAERKVNLEVFCLVADLKVRQA